MTRFWITLEQGATLVLNALREMGGGELYVPRIPSMRVVDLARVIGPECRHEIVGIRPGEKLHEMMVSAEDGRNTVDCGTHYIIQPALRLWEGAASPYSHLPVCPEGFAYTSDTNDRWLDEAGLRRMLLTLDLPGIQHLRAEWGTAA
jgi:UDP-N-acetylglucosamine 4,6-dehydratase